MSDELLNIVDADGKIIGEAPRSRIHREGLLHREVNVWFYTSRGIIFQKRGPLKDTFPNLLDATAGGHVDLNETFDQAAVREACEETGLALKPQNLHLLATLVVSAKDEKTPTHNHALKRIYSYSFSGAVSALVVEKGSGGFLEVSNEELAHVPSDDSRFCPNLLSSLRFFSQKSLKE